MSMSTEVKGFRPPDERWQQMKAVWDACVAANVPIPEPVAEFFGWTAPNPAGIEVKIPHREYTNRERVEDGIEIDVADIPDGVTVIRFINSW